MIFDERDLEDENLEEDKKPLASQIMFDDFLSQKHSAENVSSKPAKEMQKNTKKTKKSEEKPLDLSQKEEDSYEEEKIEEHVKQVEANKEKRGDFVSSDSQTEEVDNEGNILKSIKTVMNEAMMPYSEYVILDRALPRVEDGLKPVQRRILYDMYEQGLIPDKPFRKSATIVGDVIGKYHPHGDTSVYNAMVKLAQNFNMREPLVLGHGNFGSMDGDSAAAYRYTEAKLNEASLELLRDIEKDTVNWSLNYDDKLLEPDTLPSRFPNILVNGTMGIAVGIATNFACHNLAESIDACISFIDNPNITVDELMKVLKGPDFPSGAIIVGTSEIKKAYETGKGKITLRAKIEIEKLKNDKINLIISEFPYGVNKALCLQKIYELRENNKDTLSCITEIRDESGRQGVRGVISLKAGTDPQKIINYLYKYSDLQTTFGINMTAIADGKPKLLSLPDILRYYTKYQKDVVYKRTNFDLNIAKEKEHILIGLITAIENIDEIVKIIKNSASTVVAKQTLKQRYNLSERQAQAILDMRLSRLTNLEVEKLREEIDALQKLIKKLSKIVASEKLQYNLVKEEMLEIKKKFNDKRRTKIIEEDATISEDDIIKTVKPMYVLVTERNAIKKIPEKNFNKSPRIITSDSTLNEIHSHIILTSSDKNLLLFTNFGNMYNLPVEKIIEARFKDRGLLLKDLILGFNPDEKVIFITEENEKFFKEKLIFFTEQGLVKLTLAEDFKISKAFTSSIKLNGDKVINIQIFDKNKNMIFVTKEGMSLLAKTDDIPVTGKNAGGVKGISLNDGDKVIFASLIKDEKVLAITNKGFGKKVEIDNFELFAKNRKGVKIYSLSKTENTGSTLVFACILSKDNELFVVDSKSKNFVVDSQTIATTNRQNKANIIIKDRKQIEISKVFLIPMI